MQHAEARRDVEHRGRLVGEDDLGLGGERAGDGRRAGAVRRRARADGGRRARGSRPTVGEQARHLGARRRDRRRPAPRQRARQVVLDGVHRVERGERVLEDHLHARAGRARAARPSTRISPASAAQEAAQHARQRRLAAARLADERDHLAGGRRSNETSSSDAARGRRRSACRGRAPARRGAHGDAPRRRGARRAAPAAGTTREQARVGMARRAAQPLGRAHLDEPPVAQDADARGDAGRAAAGRG